MEEETIAEFDKAGFDSKLHVLYGNENINAFNNFVLLNLNNNDNFKNIHREPKKYFEQLMIFLKSKEGESYSNYSQNNTGKTLEDYKLSLNMSFEDLKIKGGNTKVKKMAKKEICGRERCIYKKPGDRKEYLKHKGELITVKDYKKLMKDKK
jgi:hypothetical protein